MDPNPFVLAKRIERPLILDGAMGSLLHQKGLVSNDMLWSAKANLKYPETVISIHRSYIKAGADIITTNTFRTNPYALKQSGINKYKSYVKASVDLALEAKGYETILIAGSNAPTEDCYQVKRTISKKELETNHQMHIDYLMESGSDFILNETQSHFDEIKLITKYCSNNKIPFVLSLFFDNDLKILSGENLLEIVSFIVDYEPLAIGFNCIIPRTFKKLSKHINKHWNWGFYLNCGAGNYTDLNIKCDINPTAYSEKVEEYLIKNPSFIGACCGSSPEHIKEIRKVFIGKH